MGRGTGDRRGGSRRFGPGHRRRSVEGPVKRGIARSGSGDDAWLAPEAAPGSVGRGPFDLRAGSSEQRLDRVVVELTHNRRDRVESDIARGAEPLGPRRSAPIRLRHAVAPAPERGRRSRERIPAGAGSAGSPRPSRRLDGAGHGRGGAFGRHPVAGVDEPGKRSRQARFLDQPHRLCGAEIGPRHDRRLLGADAALPSGTGSLRPLS